MSAHQDTAFLESAAMLGRRLCRDALWAGERCNWLGDSMEFVDNAWTVVHRALGPDLYGGTSGIALFLARLYGLTGERVFQITAEGAMAHALARAEDIPIAARIGFYAGWTGIAYAAAELACIFGNGRLHAQAFAVAGQAARDAAATPGLDVIGGSAGAIPALINLHRRDQSQKVLSLATLLGEHLLATARHSDGGWSWNTLDGQTDQDPTGFSHGVAGIAWALLELYEETGDVKFRDAAELGFAYERQWFNPAYENWPDFRKLANPPASGNGQANYAAAWCHGAPGIGLSRIRAFEILRKDELKRDAEAAIRTTAKVLTYSGQGTVGDFALCHGCSGNAELLICAAQALSDDDARSQAQTIGRLGIDRFGRHNLPWPCGVPGGGETPNLMLGLAGIGYFYLRLYDPAIVPSILIVRPVRAEHLRVA